MGLGFMGLGFRGVGFRRGHEEQAGPVRDL